MHKSIARIVGGAIFVTLLCSGVAFALPKIEEGVSPVSATQRCSLYTPTAVYIQIEDSVDIILSVGSITNTTWPKYFYPTKPAATPYSPVTYWTNNANGAKVTTKGSGN